LLIHSIGVTPARPTLPVVPQVGLVNPVLASPPVTSASVGTPTSTAQTHTEVKREEDNRRPEDLSAPVGNGQDSELEQLSVSASGGKQTVILSKVRRHHLGCMFKREFIQKFKFCH